MKILKFGAVWCSGCIIMRPRWGQIEQENPWLEVEYYDADEHTELMEKYEIETLPCVIFLDKDGEEIHREVGELDKARLQSLITEYKER